MESTEPITIPIKLSKETKNTYRYDAVEEDAAVSNLYIQKKALMDHIRQVRFPGKKLPGKATH